MSDYEFFLPNADPGLPDIPTEAFPGKGMCEGQSTAFDTIRFTIEGVPWRLRKMAQWNDEILPLDVAFAKTLESGQPADGRILIDQCCLQVSTREISEEKAIVIADDICWLLQLAWGQKVAWTHRAIRDGGEYTPLQVRGVFVSNRPSNRATIYNYRDEMLKTYLESAHPVFAHDRDWWKVTLDWIAQAFLTPAIEVAGLIYSMLLERITNFRLDQIGYPKQIDDELDAKISVKGTSRDAVATAVGAAMAEVAPKWTRDNSDALLSMILEWNKKPSYKKGIKMSFESLGLPVPANKVLDHRNSLAHNGQLGSKGLKASPYYTEITRIITELLLRLLSYKGKFFVIGLGEQHLD